MEKIKEVFKNIGNRENIIKKEIDNNVYQKDNILINKGLLNSFISQSQIKIEKSLNEINGNLSEIMNKSLNLIHDVLLYSEVINKVKNDENVILEPLIEVGEIKKLVNRENEKKKKRNFEREPFTVKEKSLINFNWNENCNEFTFRERYDFENMITPDMAIVKDGEVYLEEWKINEARAKKFLKSRERNNLIYLGLKVEIKSFLKDNKENEEEESRFRNIMNLTNINYKDKLKKVIIIYKKAKEELRNMNMNEFEIEEKKIKDQNNLEKILFEIEEILLKKEENKILIEELEKHENKSFDYYKKEVFKAKENDFKMPENYKFHDILSEEFKNNWNDIMNDKIETNEKSISFPLFPNFTSNMDNRNNFCNSNVRHKILLLLQNFLKSKSSSWFYTQLYEDGVNLFESEKLSEEEYKVKRKEQDVLDEKNYLTYGVLIKRKNFFYYNKNEFKEVERRNKKKYINEVTIGNSVYSNRSLSDLEIKNILRVNKDSFKSNQEVEIKKSLLKGKIKEEKDFIIKERRMNYTGLLLEKNYEFNDIKEKFKQNHDESIDIIKLLSQKGEMRGKDLRRNICENLNKEYLEMEKSMYNITEEFFDKIFDTNISWCLDFVSDLYRKIHALGTEKMKTNELSFIETKDKNIFILMKNGPSYRDKESGRELYIININLNNEDSLREKLIKYNFDEKNYYKEKNFEVIGPITTNQPRTIYYRDIYMLHVLNSIGMQIENGNKEFNRENYEFSTMKSLVSLTCKANMSHIISNIRYTSTCSLQEMNRLYEYIKDVSKSRPKNKLELFMFEYLFVNILYLKEKRENIKLELKEEEDIKFKNIVDKEWLFEGKFKTAEVFFSFVYMEYQMEKNLENTVKMHFDFNKLKLEYMKKFEKILKENKREALGLDFKGKVGTIDAVYIFNAFNYCYLKNKEEFRKTFNDIENSFENHEILDFLNNKTGSDSFCNRTDYFTARKREKYLQHKDRNEEKEKLEKKKEKISPKIKINMNKGVKEVEITENKDSEGLTREEIKKRKEENLLEKFRKPRELSEVKNDIDYMNFVKEMISFKDNNENIYKNKNLIEDKIKILKEIDKIERDRLINIIKKNYSLSEINFDNLNYYKQIELIFLMQEINVPKPKKQLENVFNYYLEKDSVKLDEILINLKNNNFFVFINLWSKVQHGEGRHFGLSELEMKIILNIVDSISQKLCKLLKNEFIVKNRKDVEINNYINDVLKIMSGDKDKMKKEIDYIFDNIDHSKWSENFNNSVWVVLYKFLKPFCGRMAIFYILLAELLRKKQIVKNEMTINPLNVEGNDSESFVLNIDNFEKRELEVEISKIKRMVLLENNWDNEKEFNKEVDKRFFIFYENYMKKKNKLIHNDFVMGFTNSGSSIFHNIATDIITDIIEEEFDCHIRFAVSSDDAFAVLVFLKNLKEKFLNRYNEVKYLIKILFNIHESIKKGHMGKLGEFLSRFIVNLDFISLEYSKQTNALKSSMLDDTYYKSVLGFIGKLQDMIRKGLNGLTAYSYSLVLSKFVSESNGFTEDFDIPVEIGGTFVFNPSFFTDTHCSDILIDNYNKSYTALRKIIDYDSNVIYYDEPEMEKKGFYRIAYKKTSKIDILRLKIMKKLGRENLHNYLKEIEDKPWEKIIKRGNVEPKKYLYSFIFSKSAENTMMASNYDDIVRRQSFKNNVVYFEITGSALIEMIKRGNMENLENNEDLEKSIALGEILYCEYDKNNLSPNTMYNKLFFEKINSYKYKGERYEIKEILEELKLERNFKKVSETKIEEIDEKKIYTINCSMRFVKNYFKSLINTMKYNITRTITDDTLSNFIMKNISISMSSKISTTNFTVRTKRPKLFDVFLEEKDIKNSNESIIFYIFDKKLLRNNKISNIMTLEEEKNLFNSITNNDDLTTKVKFMKIYDDLMSKYKMKRTECVNSFREIKNTIDFSVKILTRQLSPIYSIIIENNNASYLEKNKITKKNMIENHYKNMNTEEYSLFSTFCNIDFFSRTYDLYSVDWKIESIRGVDLKVYLNNFMNYKVEFLNKISRVEVCKFLRSYANLFKRSEIEETMGVNVFEMKELCRSTKKLNFNFLKNSRNVGRLNEEEKCEIHPDDRMYDLIYFNGHNLIQYKESRNFRSIKFEKEEDILMSEIKSVLREGEDNKEKNEELKVDDSIKGKIMINSQVSNHEISYFSRVFKYRTGIDLYKLFYKPRESEILILKSNKVLSMKNNKYEVTDYKNNLKCIPIQSINYKWDEEVKYDEQKYNFFINFKNNIGELKKCYLDSYDYLLDSVGEIELNVEDISVNNINFMEWFNMKNLSYISKKNEMLNFSTEDMNLILRTYYSRVISENKIELIKKKKIIEKNMQIIKKRKEKDENIKRDENILSEVISKNDGNVFKWNEEEEGVEKSEGESNEDEIDLKEDLKRINEDINEINKFGENNLKSDFEDLMQLYNNSDLDGKGLEIFSFVEDEDEKEELDDDDDMVFEEETIEFTKFEKSLEIISKNFMSRYFLNLSKDVKTFVIKLSSALQFLEENKSGYKDDLNQFIKKTIEITLLFGKIISKRERKKVKINRVLYVSNGNLLSVDSKFESSFELRKYINIDLLKSYRYFTKKFTESLNSLEKLLRELLIQTKLIRGNKAFFEEEEEEEEELFI